MLSDREGLEAERDRYQAHVTDARMQADEDRERVQEMALRVESRRSSKQSASAALERVLVQQRHLQRRREELDAQIDSTVEPLADEESALRDSFMDGLLDYPHYSRPEVIDGLASIPVPAEFGGSIRGSPELIVTAKFVSPTFSRPPGFTKCAIATCPRARLVPFE